VEGWDTQAQDSAVSSVDSSFEFLGTQQVLPQLALIENFGNQASSDFQNWRLAGELANPSLDLLLDDNLVRHAKFWFAEPVAKFWFAEPVAPLVVLKTPPPTHCLVWFHLSPGN
jgi:hypothetical protein